MDITPPPQYPDTCAGEWESLFVHLIDRMFDDDIIRFAEEWDQIEEDLSHDQRAALQKFAFLCKAIDRIAHIKHNCRSTSTALPALPLSRLLSESVQWMRPDSAATQEAWLTALGLGRATLKLADDVVTLIPGTAPRTVGRTPVATQSPSKITVKVVSRHDNKERRRPYFKVTLEPGPLEIRCGRATVIQNGPNAGKIRVEGHLCRGVTLCRGAVTYQSNATPPEGSHHSVEPRQFVFSPQLTEDMTASFYFILDGLSPKLEKIEWPELKMTLGMPALPPSLGTLRKVFESPQSPVLSEVTKTLERVAFTRLFDKQVGCAVQALLKIVQRETLCPDSQTIQSIEALTVTGGSLAIQVRTAVYQGPKLPNADTFRNVLKRVSTYSEDVS